MSEMNNLEAGIFDSHAHYDSEQFDSDRDELLSEILPSRNVIGVVNTGTDLETCIKTIEYTKKYDYFYAAVGIHPECANNLPTDWLQKIEDMLDNNKVVAVGEIGLDYHYLDLCPKQTQQKVFAAQLELANRRDMPVVIHDREAHGDILDYLREYRPKGVMHCFSGSVETSREVVKLGLYIGLGGVVTFKNARHSVEVAKDVPLDRLLLETDAPYMSPVPFRGKRNDSSYIKYAAEKIAELRSIPYEQVVNAAAENTRRLFNIK